MACILYASKPLSASTGNYPALVNIVDYAVLNNVDDQMSVQKSRKQIVRQMFRKGGFVKWNSLMI